MFRCLFDTLDLTALQGFALLRVGKILYSLLQCELKGIPSILYSQIYRFIAVSLVFLRKALK